MADVFVSYCSADREGVARLARALEQDGVSLWWDRALLPGDSYEAEIDAALANAKVVLVVWSPASAASEWVRSEADEARRGAKLVPVLIAKARIPKPFDRLHTADLTAWRGDRGNDGYPELVEAIKARLEGRAPRRIEWKRRITLAAVCGIAAAGLGFLFSALPAADTIMRWTSSGPYAERVLDKRAGGADVPPGTREGFRAALQSLSRSMDLRTQDALSKLERGDADEALRALTVLAEDEGEAIDTRMTNAGSLWRQVGLMQFNSNPEAALRALTQARRYTPDDPYTLLPLGVLLQRQGNLVEAESVYRSVLASPTAIDPAVEAAARQVIGQALVERGDFAAAESELGKAFAAADRAAADQSDSLHADLMIDKGRLAVAAGDLPGASAAFREAKDFALAIPYERAVLVADLNLSHVLIEMGQLEEAGRAIDSARELAEAQRDATNAIYVSIYASDLALARNNIDQAGGLARSALTAAEAHGLAPAARDARASLVKALLAKGEWGEASTIARSLLSSQPISIGDAAVYSAMAAVANAQGEPTACKSVFASRSRAAQSGSKWAIPAIVKIGRLAGCSV